MSVLFSVMLALVGGAPTPDASAAAPYPNGRRVRVPATRVRDDQIRIDGRVDEAAWKAVPRLPELIQIAPRFGARPTHATDVRVAYGKHGLYAAFVCHDDPEHVRGAVARKDQIPASDRVSLTIDPEHDHVSGYHFEVNPSGA
ncbi:MAG: DOMON domain-containing protein, partial [Planctomycetota bacterium]